MPTVSALKQGDKIEWLSTGDPLHLKVYSQTGIGSLVLNLAELRPDVLLVSLPLSALEGFSIRADGQTYRLEVMSNQGVLLEPNMKNPLSIVSYANKENGQPYTVRIDLKSLITTQSVIHLSWVDYYR